MEPVRSTRNPRVARAVRLRRARDRRKTGLTLLEGPNLLGEAVDAGIRPIEVFALADDEPIGGIPWTVVTPEVLAALADTESPRGPVAVIASPEPAAVTRDAVVVDVGDPGNAGTLIRSAAAFGLDVAFREGSVDPWSPKVLRAAAGAHFRTAVGATTGEGRGRIATVVAGGVDHRALPELLDPGRRWDVVVGDESRGLSPADVDGADVVVTIPMWGPVESLNAAVAGALVAEVVGRWRHEVGGPRPDH